MAFVLQIEKPFDLALSYQGPVAVLEMEFSFFFPNGASDLAFLLDIALFSFDVLPVIQANYLTYTIESEAVPLAPDHYRVKIMLAGEVENSQGELGPFVPFSVTRRPQAVFAIPPLLVIVAALGLAAFLGVVIWRTYQLTGKALGLVLVLGAIALGLGLAFSGGGRRSNG